MVYNNWVFIYYFFLMAFSLFELLCGQNSDTEHAYSKWINSNVISGSLKDENMMVALEISKECKWLHL